MQAPEMRPHARFSVLTGAESMFLQFERYAADDPGLEYLSQFESRWELRRKPEALAGLFKAADGCIGTECNPCTEENCDSRRARQAISDTVNVLPGGEVIKDGAVMHALAQMAGRTKVIVVRTDTDLIPWEYLYHSGLERMLGEVFTFVRVYLPHDRALGPAPGDYGWSGVPRGVGLLIHNGTSVRCGKDFRTGAAIRATHGKGLEVAVKLSPTLEDLEASLREKDVSILIGHGRADGAIVLAEPGKKGKRAVVRSGAFRRLNSTGKTVLMCVACNSAGPIALNGPSGFDESTSNGLLFTMGRRRVFIGSISVYPTRRAERLVELFIEGLYANQLSVIEAIAFVKESMEGECWCPVGLSVYGSAFNERIWQGGDA